MPRSKVFSLTLATLFAMSGPLRAQNANPAGPDTSSNYTQSQAAPIERPSSAYAAAGQSPYARRDRTFRGQLAVGQPLATQNASATAQPAQGIFVRVGRYSSVEAVSVDASKIELRVEHGIVNVSVRHPAEDSLVLVDLPGGQIDLVKDGFYTFNAGTNTARTLVGEAAAFAGNNSTGKPLKVKEDHAVVFNGPKLRSIEFDPMQARLDVVPSGFRPNTEEGYRASEYGDGFYVGPYGYDYPYYTYGYPYFYGYPYGFELGFGYGFGYGRYGYGGFRGRR